MAAVVSVMGVCFLFGGQIARLEMPVTAPCGIAPRAAKGPINFQMLFAVF
jgi:hypothetical protein